MKLKKALVFSADISNIAALCSGANLLAEESAAVVLGCRECAEGLLAHAGKQAGWTVAPNNYEGVRVDLDKAHGDGWFLLRMSLHDPMLPLNIESDSAGGVLTIARELAPFLLAQEGLDTAPLKALIG